MIDIVRRWQGSFLLPAFFMFFTGLSQSAQPADPVTMAADDMASTVIRQIHVLRDSTGGLTAQDIADSPASQFLAHSGNLHQGFTRDAVWIRFALQRSDEKSPSRWIMELDQPLLRDVRLFRLNPTGQVEEYYKGSTYREHQHLLDNRMATFELELPATRPDVYYLRIASQTSIATQIALWQPYEYAKARSNERFVWGAVYGAYFLIIIFYLAFWVWTREQIHLIYSIYVTVNFLASFFTAGWPWQFFPNMGEEIFLRLLGLWISLAAIAATVFSFQMIRLQSSTGKRIAWLLSWTSAAISLGGIVLVMFGHYGIAMPIVQSYIILMVILFMVIATRRSFSGDRAAQFFLFAFSFFYIGVMIRFLRNIGLIEQHFWSDNAYQIGAFFHMLVMSVSILSSYNRLRRENQLMEYRLNAQSEMQKQQAEFLSTVSHEFRTPLSIISSSSDNLLTDQSISDPSRNRIGKIIRATQRMTSLMDKYLSYERQMSEVAEGKYGVIDFSSVVRKVELDERDREGSDIRIQLGALPCIWISGNFELLRVAVQNLVSNARNYAPAASTITMELVRDEGWADFIIRDAGPGIAEEDRPRIFTKFFRGSNAENKTGVGLGLHLVKSIVEQHGGQVSQRNLTPTGCEFKIRLPRILGMD